MIQKKMLEQGLLQMSLASGDQAMDYFAHFTALLLEYNEKVNLTAVTQEEDIIIKHYLDSASLLKLREVFGIGARLIDIGCGAGFPSFPIRFLREDIRLTMLDSLNKRINFLQTVVDTLKLTQVECVHGRAEELARRSEYRSGYDVAVTRAVARLNIICEYCMPYVRPGGYFIAMKGPDVQEELLEAENAIKILGGRLEMVEKVELPFSDIIHSLILIKKISDTSSKYPRITAKIKKSPL